MFEKDIPVLKIKRVNQRAQMPRQATAGAAGLDLSAALETSLLLPPGGRATIPTGLAVQIPAGLAGFVFGRSGLGIKHGVTLSNCVGVIDSDYRGEILVGLCNQSGEPYTIQPGERIAQLVLMPVCAPLLVECAALEDSERGAGGFGSTGT